MNAITLHAFVPETATHQRLDVTLAQLFSDYSRSQLQQWIKNGDVQVDHIIIQKPRHLVQFGEEIKINVMLEENTTWIAEPIPLNIIYEDAYLMIVNKPVGLVVHPGAGNSHHTLMNALLHYAPEFNIMPRAGIVHRLDKDTSGLLVIARTLPVHNALIKQMQARKIHREYRALVHGHIISGATINEPIARHPLHRTKMAVQENGKEAITHYRVAERFRLHTLLNVQLETGRTHQIRVHLAHKDYPIVGDATYGRRRLYPTSQLSEKAQNALRELNHQALHAYQLTLKHPITKEELTWTAPLPDDFEKLLEVLREDAK